MNLTMDRQIMESLAVCDLVQGHKRSKKRLWLSFDEWNVWYRERSGAAVDGARKAAPHLLEEIYNLEDALLVGGLIITLMRHADRVKVACLAQLVNVIAPIMTNANGLFRQTIYYPYSWAQQYAKGNALDLRIEAPTYDADGMDPVPYLDAAGAINPQTGETSLFILNRDLSKAREVELVWENDAPTRIANSWTLTGDDLKAVDGFDTQRVKPQAFEKPVISGGRVKVELPARSYTVIQWAS
jgi:alpha-N-arabinofuranosidase